MLNKELWNLENAVQSATDIQFWKSEYIKRKAISDINYNKLNEYIFYIHKEWSYFIQEKYNCSGELFNRYHENFCKHLQRYFVYKIQNIDYIDNDFNFSKEYDEFLSRNDIQTILYFFFNFSTKYGYFIDDLIHIQNMEYILKNIDNIKLYQTIFHINENFHIRFEEDVLSLFRFEKKQVNIKNYFLPELSTIQNIEIIHNNKEKDTIKLCANVSIDHFKRNADFVITGQTTNDKFDLQGVHEEVCDHITWCLYENKRQKNIPLTEYEKNAVIKLYQKMAKGEYYKTHRAARAIGLWLFDKRYRFSTYRSNNEAVRALREKNLAVEHSHSDDRTLLRLLEKTRECVERGEVLAINKQSGRKQA